MQDISEIYDTELIVCGWISASLILLTSSLLFYHMTRVKSLEMNSIIASFFAVSLILLSVFMSATAIYNYKVRIDKLNTENTELLKKEKSISKNIVIMGSILSFVEVCIAITIFSGVIKTYC